MSGWDMLGRRLRQRQRQQPPTTRLELDVALKDEWNNLYQADIIYYLFFFFFFFFSFGKQRTVVGLCFVCLFVVFRGVYLGFVFVFLLLLFLFFFKF